MECLVDHARPSIKVEKNRHGACNESGAKRAAIVFEVAITRPFLLQPCGKSAASGGGNDVFTQYEEVANKGKTLAENLKVR